MTKREIIIIGLCATAVLISMIFVGYKTLQDINEKNSGTDFCVKVSGISESGVTNEEDIARPTFSDTIVTLTPSLLSNDTKTYNVTITNCGNVSARVNEVIEENNNSAILLESSGVYEGNIINAGSKATYIIRITNSNTETQTGNLKVSFDFEKNA